MNRRQILAGLTATALPVPALPLAVVPVIAKPRLMTGEELDAVMAQRANAPQAPLAPPGSRPCCVVYV